MNEHDRLKPTVDQFRELSPPTAVRNSNREAVRLMLAKPHSPWWRQSIMVPVPAVLGTAVALLISIGVHFFSDHRVSGVVVEPSSGRERDMYAVSRGSDDGRTRESNVFEFEQEPSELRRQVAGAHPKERISLLRRAGDIYLLKFRDIEQALDCYQQVLELSSPQEWAEVDPTDSWLLAELKHSITLQRAGRS